MGRSNNILRNALSGFFYKGVTLTFPFIIRTIIIYRLGAEFAGLSSLFSSILQVLSLTELGISNAIVYEMYKPISTGNTSMVSALLNLYKKLYRIVGCLILTIGLVLVPFLDTLIHGSYPSEINIYVLYFIFLLNTVLSYFLFAYKSALLFADQRQDIENVINMMIIAITYIVQIIVLIIFENYYIYILFLIQLFLMR